MGDKETKMQKKYQGHIVVESTEIRDVGRYWGHAELREGFPEAMVNNGGQI